MRLIVNGEPFVFTHKCSEDKAGTELTPAELEAFGQECLLEAFSRKFIDYRVCDADMKEETDADFVVSEDGRYLLGSVKYFDNRESEKEFLKEVTGAPEKFQKLYPNAWELYDGSGGEATPVFYVPTFECISTGGKKNIAGGRYYVSFAPYEPRSPWYPTSGPDLLEYEMYKGYAKSWYSGDDTFMRDYVLMEFRGFSEFSFLEYNSKAGLLAGVKSRYADPSEGKALKSWQLIQIPDSEEQGILFTQNNGNEFFIQLEFKDNRIYRSFTRKAPKEYERWEERRVIVQNHYNHLLPFINHSEIDSFLINAWDKGTHYDIKFKTVEGDDKIQYSWRSVMYGETKRDGHYYDIAYELLFKSKEDDTEVDFVTLFPNLYGEPHPVTILEVFEWDNQMEANVRASYKVDDREFVFWFFATDYYYRKDKYSVGAQLTIDLAASAYQIEAAQSEIVLDGDAARNFLAKTDREPKLDKDGNIEPVRFSLRSLTAYLDHHEEYPDMAEFQSPVVGDVSSIPFANKLINNAMICLNNETGIEIPLFFSSDFTPKKGDPVRGVLWMTGSILENE